MEAGYWLQRWRDGQIGFHQERVTPLLESHWEALGLPIDATVLVPLAGKSIDMDWLAARGHRVIGVEISELALSQFFEERSLVPEVHADRNGIHHRVGNLTLIQGDAFALDDALLASCDAVYDRAALIALPADLRRRYSDGMYSRLPAGSRGLLVTLEYPQREKAGPPFSVEDAEVQALLACEWDIDVLERKDILAEQPGFVAEGVTALATAVYRMQRRHESSGQPAIRTG